MVIRWSNGEIEVSQVGQTRDAVAPDHVRGFFISDGSEPLEMLL